MSSTYSFMDVTATFAGTTGVVDLGFGSAVTKEGITVTTANSRNTMTSARTERSCTASRPTRAVL